MSEPETKRERAPRDRASKRRETEIDEGRDMNTLFRKRLDYLMSGNSALGRPVGAQELADAVGVSRPAIRKYLKPKDKGAPTTPSAATVCAIARYFDTTPDFLLGFDAPDTEASRLALESEYYSALGLSQRAIEQLHALRERAELGDDDCRASELMAMLDRLICSFAEDALKLLDK